MPRTKEKYVVKCHNLQNQKNFEKGCISVIGKPYQLNIKLYVVEKVTEKKLTANYGIVHCCLNMLFSKSQK